MAPDLGTDLLDLARYHQRWAWNYARHAWRLGRSMTPKERRAYDIHSHGARTAYEAWRELRRLLKG
ncbi:MAG: hypothetical protein ACWGPR_10855 [Candidatus Deferrimicrobiaceae bacterium]